MFKKKLEKVIEDIQSKNKGITQYPKLSEICDPGQTGFKCRKVGVQGSGYILIDLIEPPVRKRMAGDKELLLNKSTYTPEDSMGIFPFLAIVFESAAECCEPGDIIVYDSNAIQGASKVLVKGGTAFLISDSTVMGVDNNYKELMEKVIIDKPIADA